MKKLMPKIVAVKRIDIKGCLKNIEEFSDNQLDEAARCSLLLGGFVIPPVLLRRGDEINPSYEILSGYFQCFAAQLAQSIDPVKGETIPAVVICQDDPDMGNLLQQLNYSNYYADM